MVRPCIDFAATIHRLLQIRAPSNVLLDLLRTRRGLKWAIPTGCVMVPTYLYAASLTAAMIENGASGWLNVLAMMLCWNAFKFAAMAMFCVPRLVRARMVERHARRVARLSGYSPSRELGPWTTRA